MVVIKGVSAKAIKDSRGEKTIEVSIKTDFGNFKASSPQGKSTGTFEVKLYKKSLEEDIRTLKKFSDYFEEEIIDQFADLKIIEDTLAGHVGGNTVLALQYATLKSLAKEHKKQIWEIVISHDLSAKAKRPKFPRLVQNCIGGAKHSKDLNNKKPDFQEFLLIPKINSPKKSWEQNKKAQKQAEVFLKKEDKNFNSKKNDESAWTTSLNEKQVLDLLKKLSLPLGTDIAASGFYKRKNYHYKNPMLRRTINEQLFYLSNLIKNLDLIYIEDPFEENDFDSFAKLLKKHPESLIVGDDLTVTNSKRLKRAIEEKSINAIIVKPNQCGSLIEVKRVCDLANKHNIKLVFSHRSGETDENILADLAFGFQADFFKIGITGKERESKIKRLIEIEKFVSKR